jgi:hypothetical protein
MTHRALAPLLLSLAACAGPAGPGGTRPPQSPAAAAIPVADPAARWTPQAPPVIQPVEVAQVRVRRGADGRVTIVEFLSAGLTEPEQARVRLWFENGELKVAREGAAGEESWVTGLTRAGPAK